MIMKKSLGAKIIFGYLVIICFVVMTGAVGYYGIRTVAKSLHIVGNEEAPVVVMANEMKLSLMKARNTMEEFKAATSTIASDDATALKDIKNSYDQTLKEFDIFGEAILNGAVLEDGTVVVKTDNKELSDLVVQADTIHNEKFQVAAMRMMALGKSLLKRTSDRTIAMEGMEDVYNEVFVDSSEVEGMISSEIARRASESKIGMEALAILSEEVPLADMANEIKIAIAETRIALEEFIQTTDPKELNEIEKRYHIKIASFDQNVNAILNGGIVDGARIIATDNNAIRTAVHEMDQDHEAFQAKADDLMKKQREIVETGKNVEQAMVELDTFGNEAGLLLNKVEASAGREMTFAKNKGASAVSMSVMLIFVAIFVSLFSGIGIGVFLTRSITNPLNKVMAGLHTGAEQVASASGQISTSSQSLAEGASEQAASIEETSASIEEISSMTKQNAENATEADNLMKTANTVVGQANTSMIALIESMDDISKSSEETSKIIKTIDEIAFQTNLLALNAAVEAARAGEAGAGFAVVADEVRNLAMRAADAAKNTAELIEGTVKKIQTGSELVNDTNDSFNAVSENAGKVGALVSEIAEASKEQSSGIEQVNIAVTEMDKVTQQNAANAEESASASEEMSAQAAQMMSFVDDLYSMVKGGSNDVAIAEKFMTQDSEKGSSGDIAQITF